MRIFAIALPLIVLAAAAHGRPCADFLDPSNQFLIQEIMNLRNGDQLPPKLFEMYDGRTIAESMVARIWRMEQQTRRSDKRAYDYLKKTEILYHFDSKHLQSVLLNGFQTRYQQPMTRAEMAGAGLRKQREEELIRLRLGNDLSGVEGPMKFLYPKYAMVGLTRPSYYCDLIGYSAVFKDEVKLRSTWTSQDSYASGEKERARSFFYQSARPVLSRGQYFEAQIWGPLDIRDVKEFRVPKNVDEEILADLKRVGLPIYEYSLPNIPENIRQYKPDRSQAPMDRPRVRKLYSGHRGRIQEYNDSLEQSRKFPSLRMERNLQPLKLSAIKLDPRNLLAKLREHLNRIGYKGDSILIRKFNLDQLPEVLTTGTDRNEDSTVWSARRYDSAPYMRDEAGITPQEVTYAHELDIRKDPPALVSYWTGERKNLPFDLAGYLNLDFEDAKYGLVIYDPDKLVRVAEVERWFKGHPSRAVLGVFSIR